MNYSLVGKRMANQMQGDGVVNSSYIDDNKSEFIEEAK